MPSRKRMNVPILRPISHLQTAVSGGENSVTQGNRIVEASVLGRNSSPGRGTTAAQYSADVSTSPSAPEKLSEDSLLVEVFGLLVILVTAR